jgi:hypothetical protein
MWRHYVYVHRRADDGSVFYVGKGSVKPKYKSQVFCRADSSDRRSDWWKRVVDRHGRAVEIVASFIDEASAFSFEKELIASHVGLVNMTAGGEGAVGRKRSPESIAKWRAAMDGRPHIHAGVGPMFGRKHSEESRQLISQAVAGTNNPMFGRRHSPATLDAMRGKINAGSEKKAAPVVDVATGRHYPSIRNAAFSLGYNPSTLKQWLRVVYENRSTLRYA